MKIAFCLFKYFPFGGLQRDFKAIAQAALARGYQVDVYTLEWQGDVPQGFNINIIKVKGFTNHKRYWNFSDYVSNQLAHKKYDIIFGFNKMAGLDVYFAADPCYVAMSEKIRRAWYRLIPRYRHFLKLEKAVFSQMSQTDVLAITHQQMHDLMAYYGTPREQFHLLPPWITVDRMRPNNWREIRKKVRLEFNVPEEDNLLLLIGSGFKTKGLDRAIMALHALPKSLREKTHFFIIGQDKPKPFLKQAKKLGVAEKLRFLHGRTDIPNFLFSADALIHPAYSETAGIVIIEAIAAGLPCLVTDVCGYAHHVKQARSGLIVPSPYEQDTFNQLFYELLTTDTQQYSMNALTYCSNKNFFKMPEIVVDIIEEKLKGKQLSSRNHLRQQLLNPDNFSQVLDIKGEVYRELDGRKTLRFEYKGHGYFAKIHYGVGWKEIVKNFAQGRFPVLSAKNEYRAILRLKQLTVDTMEPVAYRQKGFNPAKLKSFIVTDELPNTISLEDYCATWIKSPPTFKLKQAIIKKTAEIARVLHMNGVNHRDFYICHLLLDISEGMNNIVPEKLKMYIIDLHRVQTRQQTPYRWIVKDTGSLYFSAMNVGLTRRDIFRFIKIYQNKSLRQTMAEDVNFWREVQERGIYLYYKAFRKMPTLVTKI